MKKRKISFVECNLCKKSYGMGGFQSHLFHTHNLTPDEYVIKFGEYRPKKISLSNYEGGEFVCKIDNVSFKTNKMLSGYIKRKYKMLWKDYIIKYIFDGKIPLCKCGCKKFVKILNSPPYQVDFLTGHNANPMKGKLHTNESRTLMSIRAKKRIELFREKNVNSPLPMHTVESLKIRGEIYSNKMMGLKCKVYDITLLNDYEERNNSIYKFECNNCKSIYTQYHNSYFTCTKCNPRIRSKYEEELVDFIKPYLSDGDLVRNFRKQFNGRSEVDIFIPSKNVAIEFNGLYWHSEKSGNKPKRYHVDKTNLCENEGIRLIQIFEDDWLDKKEIIKSKLLHILNVHGDVQKVYARKCECLDVSDSLVKKEFLLKNHIQGNDNSSIKIGLFFDGELVSLITFGSLSLSKGYRTSQEGEYELIRFCSDHKIVVVGAFSKLLSCFIKKYKPMKIITYADKCYSSKFSNVYLKNGFTFIGDTSPNYWYTNDYKHRLYRFNFTKQKLIDMGHDTSKTEKQIMQELGYDRIWECGHLKYEMTFNQ